MPAKKISSEQLIETLRSEGVCVYPPAMLVFQSALDKLCEMYPYGVPLRLAQNVFNELATSSSYLARALDQPIRDQTERELIERH